LRTTRIAQLQERFEGSRGGRAAINLFVLVTLVAIVVSNLPRSSFQRRAYSIAQPYLNYTGTDQRWTIFAPFPRSDVFFLEARVIRANGTISIWRPPTHSRLVGAYRDERWLKLVEHTVLRSDADGWPLLWPTVARYAARQVASHGSRPVVVELIRREAQELPPGKGPPYLTPFVDTMYYSLQVGAPA
jgi:hypothetical protein